MITADFLLKNGAIFGFEIKGHSGSAERGQDIICSAVSSPVFMVANTITEIMKIDAFTDVSDGYMKLTVEDFDKCSDIFKGLLLHFQELSKQYMNNFKVITTEV